jgi:hypothetical protein
LQQLININNNKQTHDTEAIKPDWIENTLLNKLQPADKEKLPVAKDIHNTIHHNPDWLIDLDKH